MGREAIILAGGFGTRLSSVVPNLPKPMAPVNGRPFLVILLEYLRANEIRDVILSVGYKYDEIVSFFGGHFSDVDIRYCI